MFPLPIEIISFFSCMMPVLVSALRVKVQALSTERRFSISTERLWLTFHTIIWLCGFDSFPANQCRNVAHFVFQDAAQL